ncbi:spore coat protein [Paenibacillus flagellatus]|uniref:Spore coat protein n=1 Tax=Paenibacillus flagellatus TaxID=2211139 RepID=A0A2V5L0V8_9BACL|nr:spore coat protein [Paenibacillus flagellatus]PYI56266.1 spore coat protein [Paenibacillus flagellatus]
MPFGAHETMEVHEILNEKLNLINHFSLYAQQAQHPELRQMIDRHLQTAMQSYDQLVGYTHDYGAAANRQQPYGMPQVRPQQVQYGLHEPAPLAPVQGRFDDVQIASSMLSCHKNSAKNHMAGSLECADPNVREMLVNGAIACANQAYEVFLFMNRMGAYQVPTMQDHTAKTFLHTYQPAQSGTGMGMGMGTPQ